MIVSIEICLDLLKDPRRTYVNALNANFGIIFFGLELQLDVQAQDLGVVEGLWLLLESSVGKSLLKCNTVNKHGVLIKSVSKLFLELNLLSSVPAWRRQEPF